MRGDGEILLVSCYELGHQPLALASTLGLLTAAGLDAGAVDTSVELLADERLCGARFVGISVPMHTALRLATRIAERARKVNQKAHICFFGLYASLNAEWLLSAHADSIIGGEYETALVLLIEALARGETPHVAGVSTPGHRSRPGVRRQALVAPRRDTLPPLERYAPLIDGGERRTAGYVEATRGCRHLCRHCPIVPVYAGRFLAVPADLVLADALDQVARGATHITFGDPDFLNGPGHTMPIARALHRTRPDVTFDVTAKVEHVLRHRALMPELRALGCAFLLSAVESLSNEVLAYLDKGHTRDEVDEALAILDAAGLPLRPTFVPFTPWATVDDYHEILDWVDEHDLIESVEPVQLAIRLLIPPGSALLALPPGPGWPGPLDPERLTHRWVHPDPRMDALHGAVTRRVEQAATVGEPERATFAALRALADAADRAPTARTRRPLLGPRRDRPPRLAEAWFC